MKKFLLLVVVTIALLGAYLIHLGASLGDLISKPLAVFNDLILNKIEPGAQPPPAPSTKPSPTPTAPPRATPVQAVATPTPSVQLTDTEIIHQATSAIAVVEGQQGSGAGFIGKIGTANFLLTNVHVVAQNATPKFMLMDGTVVSQEAPAVAAGRDVLALSVPASAPALEMMTNVDQNAKVGDEVMVLGTGQGGHVLAPVDGRIVGFGPDSVEVDALFPPECSGGPIIHKKSGKVIGIATYAMVRSFGNLTGANTQGRIKRFGNRVDSIKQWQPVSWPEFNAEAGQMANIERTTDDLLTLYHDVASSNRVDLGKYRNPAIRGAFHQFASVMGGPHPAGNTPHIRESLDSFFRTTCQTDIVQVSGRFAIDYFQRELAEEKQCRDDLADNFDKLLKFQSTH